MPAVDRRCPLWPETVIGTDLCREFVVKGLGLLTDSLGRNPDDSVELALARGQEQKRAPATESRRDAQKK